MSDTIFRVVRRFGKLAEDVCEFPSYKEALEFCHLRQWEMEIEGDTWNLSFVEEKDYEPSFMTVDAYLYLDRGYCKVGIPETVKCIRISLTVSCYAEAQRQLKALIEGNPNIVSYEMNIIER